MPYNQYGQYVDDSGYSPMPGAGMPSVVSGNYNADRTFGPDWGGGALQAIRMMSDAQPQRGGQSGPYDNVYTGHATERVPESPEINALLPTVQRRYFNAGAPDSIMQIGDQRTVTPRPAMSQAQQIANFLQARQSDPQLRNLNGLQFSQLFTNAVGVDPLSYQKQQQDSADHNLKVVRDQQQEEIARKKQAMDEYQMWGKTAGDQQQEEIARKKQAMDEYQMWGKTAGGLPEDILASFGRNAAPGDHRNEYFAPGRFGMSEDGEPPKEIPGGWRGIDPGTVQRLRELRQTLGLGTLPPFSSDSAAAEIARGKAYQAKAGIPANASPAQQPIQSSQASSIPPFGPFAAQPFGDPASATSPFVRDVRSAGAQIAPWLRAILSAPGRLATGARDALDAGVGAASQYFTGEKPMTDEERIFGRRPVFTPPPPTPFVYDPNARYPGQMSR